MTLFLISDQRLRARITFNMERSHHQNERKQSAYLSDAAGDVYVVSKDIVDQRKVWLDQESAKKELELFSKKRSLEEDLMDSGNKRVALEEEKENHLANFAGGGDGPVTSEGNRHQQSSAQTVMASAASFSEIAQQTDDFRKEIEIEEEEEWSDDGLDALCADAVIGPDSGYF